MTSGGVGVAKQSPKPDVYGTSGVYDRNESNSAKNHDWPEIGVKAKRFAKRSYKLKLIPIAY